MPTDTDLRRGAPLIVDRMTVHEWNALARLLGSLYSVTYDPVHEQASFVHYDPVTGTSRQLERN